MANRSKQMKVLKAERQGAQAHVHKIMGIYHKIQGEQPRQVVLTFPHYDQFEALTIYLMKQGVLE